MYKMYYLSEQQRNVTQVYMYIIRPQQDTLNLKK